MSDVWQRINSTLERIRVPGGWLYRTDNYVYGTGATIALAFVPDPEIVENDAQTRFDRFHNQAKMVRDPNDAR